MRASTGPEHEEARRAVEAGAGFEITRVMEKIMGHPALNIKPEAIPSRAGPSNYSFWCWPHRDLSEHERWRIYDDAKLWRWQQELAEVPITEDYREFCCRVCRELEI